MSSKTDDPEIVLRLPLSAVYTIMQHLGAGAFNTVVTVVNAIVEQGNPQIALALAAAPSNTMGSSTEPAAPAGPERLN